MRDKQQQKKKKDKKVARSFIEVIKALECREYAVIPIRCLFVEWLLRVGGQLIGHILQTKAKNKKKFNRWQSSTEICGLLPSKNRHTCELSWLLIQLK